MRTCARNQLRIAASTKRGLKLPTNLVVDKIRVGLRIAASTKRGLKLQDREAAEKPLSLRIAASTKRGLKHGAINRPIARDSILELLPQRRED